MGLSASSITSQLVDPRYVCTSPGKSKCESLVIHSLTPLCMADQVRIQLLKLLFKGNPAPHEILQALFHEKASQNNRKLPACTNHDRELAISNFWRHQTGHKELSQSTLSIAIRTPHSKRRILDLFFTRSCCTMAPTLSRQRAGNTWPMAHLSVAFSWYLAWRTISIGQDVDSEAEDRVTDREDLLMMWGSCFRAWLGEVSSTWRVLINARTKMMRIFSMCYIV